MSSIEIKPSSLRLKVFRVITAVCIVAPILGEVAGYYGAGALSPSLYSSILLAVGSALIYLLFLSTKRLELSIKMDAILALLAFSWGTLGCGGIRSEQFVYLTLFPIAYGFLLGRTAVVVSTLYGIAFIVVLAFLESSGNIPFVYHSLLTVTVQSVACLLMIGWVVVQYESARVDSELKIQAALDEVELHKQFLQSFGDASPTRKFAKTIDGKFLYVNKAFIDLVQMNESEILGKTVFDLFKKEDAEKMTQNDFSIISSKKSRIIEELIPTPLGPRWHLTSLFPITDGSGVVRYLGGAITDVHESRSAIESNKAIIDALSKTTILAFTDKKGKITKVNQKFCDISGYSEAELLGKDHRIINSGTHPKQFFQDLWATIRSGAPWVGDICNKAKNGSLYYVRSVITPIKNPRGEIEQYIAIRFDVTNEVKSQTEFKTLVETMSEGLIIQNQDGKIIHSNPAALPILGVTKEGLESTSSTKYNWEVVREDGTSMPPEEFASKRALKTNKAVTGTIVGLKFPNNETRWLKTNATPILSHGESKVVVTFIDISEIKRREYLLSQSEAKLRSLFEASPYPILAFDKTGIIDCNSAAIHLLQGQSKEEIVRQHPAVFSPEYQPDGLSSQSKSILMDSIAREKGFHRFEWMHRTLKGVDFPVEVTLTCVNEGRDSLLLVIWRDLTEEKALEKELESQRIRAVQNAKLVSLGEMSAGIAHEINNPLAIIAGNAMLLKKFKSSSEKVEQQAEIILRSSARIEKIVKGLRKFSRQSEGLQNQICSIAEIIKESLVLTDSNINRNAVLVTTEIADNLMISCNEVEIEQVMVNLINNSIDAIKTKDDKWIKISAFREKDQIVMQVVDSGGGISPKVEEKLFQPFFTTKPVGQGTGLGLSITKGILEQHGATISLNRKFQNTCFEIRFLRAVEVKAA